MHAIALTQKILTFMSKTGECRQQKYTQHAPTTKTKCDYFVVRLKNGHTRKSLTQNGEPQRQSWERRRRRGRKPPSSRWSHRDGDGRPHFVHIGRTQQQPGRDWSHQATRQLGRPRRRPWHALACCWDVWPPTDRPPNTWHRHYKEEMAGKMRRGMWLGGGGVGGGGEP